MCTDPTTTIDDCVSYGSNTTCSGCQEGYTLVGNECKEITAENCMTSVVGDVAKCSVCKDNKKNNFTTKVCTDDDCGLTDCANCTAIAAD